MQSCSRERMDFAYAQPILRCFAQADVSSAIAAPAQSSARTLTYDPGASSIGFSLPSPGWRAGTSPPAYCETHSSQPGPHESGPCAAPASHSSGVGGLLSLTQCPYLLPGGLTTPAICPEADSTNLTGPEKSCVAA